MKKTITLSIALAVTMMNLISMDREAVAARRS